MRRILVLLATASFVVLVLSGAARPALSSGGRWVVVDLGTFGGQSSRAVAINEKGGVVGSAETARVKWGRALSHAFLWRTGMTDLGLLPGCEESFATGVNDRGQVIGTCNGGVAGSSRAFLWDKGRLIDLNASPGGYLSVGPAKISNTGQVVGTYVKGVKVHGFSWEKGRLTDLGSLGGIQTWAVAVNDRGQVVGYSETGRRDGGLGIVHGFLWQRGKMIDLGVLPGGTSSRAVAINGRGQIAAFSYRATSEPDTLRFSADQARAFVWQGGRKTAMGSVRGWPYAEPSAINGQGQVVGDSYSGEGKYWGASNSAIAFAWTSGHAAASLGTLGGQHSRALGINNGGQVVGYSGTGKGTTHAFVWQNGKMIDLGVGQSGKNSIAVAINDRGQVIGCDTSVNKPGHALLWTPSAV